MEKVEIDVENITIKDIIEYIEINEKIINNQDKIIRDMAILIILLILMFTILYILK